RRHTRSDRDWSSDMCSSDLAWNALAPCPLPLAAMAGGRCGTEGTTTCPGVVVELESDPLLAVPELAFAANGPALAALELLSVPRSEERRVGKECRSGWWPGP